MSIIKNIAFLTLLCVCLGSLPLAALKGQDDETPKNLKPVAAAAGPNESQARPKPKAAARQVAIRSSRVFILDAEVLETLQSTAPGRAEDKESLLENAVRAVELLILGPITLPDDTTKLMAPFVSVRSLYMGGGS